MPEQKGGRNQSKRVITLRRCSAAVRGKTSKTHLENDNQLSPRIQPVTLGLGASVCTQVPRGGGPDAGAGVEGLSEWVVDNEDKYLVTLGSINTKTYHYGRLLCISQGPVRRPKPPHDEITRANYSALCGELLEISGY